MAASLTVAKESMLIAGEQAYSQAAAVQDSPSNPRECAASFDDSWNRRGDYPNQGSQLLLTRTLGKCWIILCMIGCATRVVNGRSLAVTLAQRSMMITGLVINTSVSQTTRALHNQWSHKQLLMCGRD